MSRYEKVFSHYSYGFRPNRSAHGALRTAGAYVKDGRDWIIDIDLEMFLNNVNQQRLMWLQSGGKTIITGA